MSEHPAFPNIALKGGQLQLRALNASDDPDIVAAASDSLTQRWLPLPNPYTLDHALEFRTTMAEAQRDSGRGLIRGIEVEGRLAGCIDLKRTDWIARTTEIGYWTCPWARGRGVMPAAVRLLAEWVIGEQGFERVELRIAPQNVPSIRVAEKAGFVREGTARNAGIVHDGRVDLTIYSLVRYDLRRPPQGKTMAVQRLSNT
jgi:RimJ/RimL family protein N-acetyltransferase